MTVAKLIKNISFETVGKVCHLFQDLDVSGSNLDKDLNLYPYLDSIGDINRPYKREFIGKIKWVINYLPRWTYHLLYPNIPLIVFSLFYCRYSFNQPGQIFLLCGKMWIWIFFAEGREEWSKMIYWSRKQPIVSPTKRNEKRLFLFAAQKLTFCTNWKSVRRPRSHFNDQTKVYNFF